MFNQLSENSITLRSLSTPANYRKQYKIVWEGQVNKHELFMSPMYKTVVVEFLSNSKVLKKYTKCFPTKAVLLFIPTCKAQVKIGLVKLDSCYCRLLLARSWHLFFIPNRQQGYMIIPDCIIIHRVISVVPVTQIFALVLKSFNFSGPQ